MNYLLDTNILSETIKPKPNKNLIKWLYSSKENDFFISSITIGEIRKGIEILAIKNNKKDSKKTLSLRKWLNDITINFQNKIINVDKKIALTWGELTAYNKSKAIDALIAATAKENKLVLATRNEKDMGKFGIKIFNPFI